MQMQAASRSGITRGAGSASAIHVCVVSDNILISQILKKYLGRSSRFRVVEQQRLVPEDRLVPCVAIVDLNSLGPKPGNVPALEVVRTILLGDIATEDLCRFLSLGVNGFVRYCEVERKLRRAVEVVASGRLYVSRSALEAFVRYARHSNTSRIAGPLTPRQKEILQLLESRYTNKEIGSHLGISENTVKFHLAKIYSKLEVGDRHTAVHQMRVGMPQDKATPGPANGAHNALTPVMSQSAFHDAALSAHGQGVKLRAIAWRPHRGREMPQEFSGKK